MLAWLVGLVLAQDASTVPAPPTSVVAAREAIEAHGPRLVRDAVAFVDGDDDVVERALQQRAFEVSTGAGEGWIVAVRPRPDARRTIGFLVSTEDQAYASLPVAWGGPSTDGVLWRERGRGAVEGVLPPQDGEAVDRALRFEEGAVAGRFELAALLAAIDALDAAGIGPATNLVVAIDRANRLEDWDELAHEVPLTAEHAADLWCVFAGTPLPTSRATVAFGARGCVDVELTFDVASPTAELGTYGGIVHNAAQVLATEIAALRSERGSVQVAGFYDDGDVPTDTDLIGQALEATPDVEATLKDAFRIDEVELPGVGLSGLALRPSLEVVTLDAGRRFADDRAFIAGRASAMLRAFTIPGQTRDHVVRRLREHLASRGFVVTDAPLPVTRLERPRIASCVVSERGFVAQRTTLDHALVMPLFQALFAIEREPPVIAPSLPAALDLSILPLKPGGARVLLPQGNDSVSRLPPRVRESGTVGAYFRCIETAAAVIEVGGR